MVPAGHGSQCHHQAPCKGAAVGTATLPVCQRRDWNETVSCCNFLTEQKTMGATCACAFDRHLTENGFAGEVPMKGELSSRLHLSDDADVRLPQVM